LFDCLACKTMLKRRDLLRLMGGCAFSLSAARLASAQAPRVLEEPWTSGHLAGTFAQPGSGEPSRGPGVLIIAGSGPSSRDGSFNTYRLLAQGLASAGIRSLRYDKRGVGQSRPLVTREDDLTLQHFVDDAILAAQNFAARPDVSSVVMVGHSEGALIATLAAARMPLAGIVLLAGTGRRLDVVIREQLMAMPLPESMEHVRREALSILEKLSRGERVAEVSAENAPLFRVSVQPFLLSVFAIDPAAELAKLTLPVMLVRGTSDIQVSAEDLDLLAQARPDARILRLPETNHAFKPAPADVSNRTAQLRSYDPAAPLVPGLVPAIVEFVRGNAR
jgi:pimeloyl-ACP methyl ester carboxylesterase